MRKSNRWTLIALSQGTAIGDCPQRGGMTSLSTVRDKHGLDRNNNIYL